MTVKEYHCVAYRGRSELSLRQGALDFQCVVFAAQNDVVLPVRVGKVGAELSAAAFSPSEYSLRMVVALGLIRSHDFI